MTAKNQHRPRSTDTDQLPLDQRIGVYFNKARSRVDQFFQRLPTQEEGSHLPNRRSPSHEQIQLLIDALGDTEHPAHARAVEDLAAIGEPAVPWLVNALDKQQSWLVAYRASEALGYIGSGRATSALIQALEHPNSNVRWSAVRALAQIGDLRALLELRRVAHNDTGRTSWGESVAVTAQNALDQLRARSMWGQSLELVKTAITSVLMILALVIAYRVVTELRVELSRINDAQEIAAVQSNLPQLPEESPEAAQGVAGVATPLAEPQPTQPLPTPTSIPTPTPGITGTVLQRANVRPEPTVQNEPIGLLNSGDEVIFLAQSADGNWYQVRLGSQASDASAIGGPDGADAGWVSASLLSSPSGEVPVATPVPPDATELPASTPVP
jgi:hypothetical protein